MGRLVGITKIQANKYQCKRSEKSKGERKLAPFPIREKLGIQEGLKLEVFSKIRSRKKSRRTTKKHNGQWALKFEGMRVQSRIYPSASSGNA